MCRIVVVLLAALVLSGARDLRAQALSPEEQQALDSAFPQDLRAGKADGVGTPQNTCGVTYQSAGPTPLVVAGFADGTVGRVSMMRYIRGSGGTMTPLFTLDEHDFGFGGTTCRASLVNLADPAQKHAPLAKVIKLTFDDGADWYFTWDGSSLVSIGATSPAQVPGLPADTAMYHSQPVDADRTGTLELVGEGDAAAGFDPGADPVRGPAVLFRFDGTRYQPARTSLFWGIFDAQQGLGYEWTSTFRVEAPENPYTLRILNGTRRGTDRVTAAVVGLNGRPVVGATDVSTGVATLDRTVTLAPGKNVLTVKSSGPVEAVMYVIVERP